MKSIPSPHQSTDHNNPLIPANPLKNAPRPNTQRRPTTSRRHGAILAVSVCRQTDHATPQLARWIKTYFQKAARLATDQPGTLCLVITDDQRIKSLHQEFLNKPTTTDVLTFDLSDAPSAPDGVPPNPSAAKGRPANPRREKLEADIVINLDQASRQAARRGHEVHLELLLYAIHGLLHLLGADDHNATSAEQMHRWEDLLLLDLGLPPAYHRPPTNKKTSPKRRSPATGRR